MSEGVADRPKESILDNPEEALDQWLEKNEFDRIYFPGEQSTSTENSDNFDELVLALEGLVAIPNQEESLAFYGQFDPREQSLIRTCFRLRSLDFFFENVHDCPLTKSPNSGNKIRSWIYDLRATETINDETATRFQREIEDQLSHISDREDLYESVSSRSKEDVQYWLDKFLTSFTGGRSAFISRLQLFESIRDWRPPQNESTTKPTQNDDSDKNNSDKNEEEPSLPVTARSDPHDGIPAAEIIPHQEIIVQLIGEAAEGLPDSLRDSESNHPKSVPLVGWVHSIEGSTPATESNERKIEGELENGINFECTVHNNDRIKTPGDPTESSEDLTMLFGSIISIFLIVLIVFLALIFL